MAITITINSGTALIDVPYNTRFVQQVKRLGGRWMPEQKRWAIDARNVEHVRAAMLDCYGRTDVSTDELVTVRVTVGDKGMKSRCRGSIEMFGRIVARAMSRDGGARNGDGIVFVAGRPGSGGSVKNWETIIYAGSVFLIRDVPRSFVVANQQSLVDQGHTIEIEEQVVVDREQLTAERERLATRIAEIDRLLTTDSVQ